MLRSKDARTLARALLAMGDEDFRMAFKGSPMKRAKLRGLKRNAAVVLGNIGNSDDTVALTQALGDSEPLVRAHAAWALARIGSASGLEARRLPLRHESQGRLPSDRSERES
jgi:epoxyqueuosine reductase QueG